MRRVGGRGRAPRPAARRRDVGVEVTAPIATSEESRDFGDAPFPSAPPSPLGVASKPPLFRPLKVYAVGPSRGRTPGNIRSIDVRYEKLAPGPVGARIAVVDYDATRGCFYDPVDLDDPLIAINGGLDPSESDPKFHQQMVYAVASETLRRVEVALGRTVRRRSPEAAVDLRLIIHPHAGMMDNSYSTRDGSMFFGYFRAKETATGRTVPGQTVFTCLSHDVVVHQTVHTILGALRPDLMLDSMSLDDTSLQEALADLTPLLFHFTHSQVVLETIQRTAGVLFRSHLDAERDPGGDAPRIAAEIASANPLLAVSQDFGEAIGKAAGIRNALADLDPTALDRADEPHARGAIVVAAVFDALFSIYQRRTLDLFRIFRAGGGRLQGNDVPEPLAARLFDEVGRVASRFFNMCWRAFDYCPAVHVSLGDYLRACVTADYEYTREDEWGVRDSMMQAFRLRGIKPTAAAFFTEDALRWPLVHASALPKAGLDPGEFTDESVDPSAMRSFVTKNAAALGFAKTASLAIYPLEVARHTAPDDSPRMLWNTQIIDHAAKTGLTVVFDDTRELRYAIPTSPVPPPRPRKGHIPPGS
jgi:hypothetical protein